MRLESSWLGQSEWVGEAHPQVAVRRPAEHCVNNIVHILLDIKEITGFIEHKF